MSNALRPFRGETRAEVAKQAEEMSGEALRRYHSSPHRCDAACRNTFEVELFDLRASQQQLSSRRKHLKPTYR